MAAVPHNTGGMSKASTIKGDACHILGPFNAGTLLYMLENGQIDRNTSLIKQYGAPGTTEF